MLPTPLSIVTLHPSARWMSAGADILPTEHDGSYIMPFIYRGLKKQKSVWRVVAPHHPSSRSIGNTDASLAGCRCR